MTIAVTGATGALGGLVVGALLERRPAEEIVAVVRDPGKADRLREVGVEVRVADYGDPAALHAAFDGVDQLLLVSGSEVGQRIGQHANVIDAAKEAGVERVVYTSAPNATESDLVLAPEHKATEEYLVASGLAYTIVRNNWYHENYAQQIEIARSTGSVVAAAGDGRVASASRADYAAGAAVVLNEPGHEGQVYEFTGDVAWTYDDLASAIGDAIGQAVVYQPVSAAELVTQLTSAGLDAQTAQFVAALDQNIADGLLARVDPTLTRLIGRPTTPLVDALRSLA